MVEVEVITETRKQILEASLNLFSRNGYKATTTRDIASEAGVNEITIFRNFGSKENLLADCLDFGFDAKGLKESIPAGITGNREQDLFNLLLSMRSNLRERERVYSIMFREIATNAVVRDKVSGMPRIMKGFMLEKLESILGDDVRDDIDIETAGIFLASYYLRSEMMRMMMGADPFHEVDERRMREVISVFLEGILKKED
jgi:AcrR family transcriptional regulator